MRCSVASWPCFPLLLMALAPVGPVASASAQTSVLVGTPAEQQAEVRIRAALMTQVGIRSTDERLDAVLARLGGQLQIPIQLDRNALEAINITGENLVTIQVSDVSARSALQLICRKLDPTLTCAIDKEVLVLTTKEESQNMMQTRIYPVGDLIETREDGHGGLDFEPLLEVICTVVEPASWDREGGVGAVQTFPAAKSLVCTQTSEVHEKVDLLIKILRQVRDPARTMSAALSAARAAEESADENAPEPDIEALLGSHTHVPKIDTNPAPWRVPQRYDE